MRLSCEYNLPGFCQMLDSEAGMNPASAGLVVDWMHDNSMCRPEAHADVCLLYARDKEACEGVPESQGFFCDKCERSDYEPVGIGRCACGGYARLRRISLTPLLPTDFPQAVFAEWCRRVLGVLIPAMRLSNRFCSPHLWCVTDDRGNPFMSRLHHTKAGAAREMKQRALAYVPVTGQQGKSARQFVPVDPYPESSLPFPPHLSGHG